MDRLPDSYDNLTPGTNHNQGALDSATTTGTAVEGRAPAGFIPLSSIMHRARPALDLEAVRARLAGKRGQEYWRSIDELAVTPEFQEFVTREFPRQAPASWEGVSRRDFLKVMGAGLALAGLSGCVYQPREMIVPYVEQPEQLIPGKPLYYATATLLGGYANGVLAESQMGRPIKIEGNPDHPGSLGATDIFMQASVLSMYDPDRSGNILNRGVVSSWENFLGVMQAVVDSLGKTGGAGLAILTGAVTSPTLASQLKALLKALPNAKWHQYEAVHRDNMRAGARLAFDTDVDTIYHFDQAKRVVSLDADFLLTEPGHVRYSRDFIMGRKVRQGVTADAINRLYVLESTPTVTGMMADHRQPVPASQIEACARALAQQLGVAGVTGTAPQGLDPWLAAVAADLKSQAGASVVVPGEFQSPAVHALAHAMNAALGNVGKTVEYVTPVEAVPLAHTESLQDLAADLHGGKVRTLMLMGGNPVYDAPVDLDFESLIKGGSLTRPRLVVHLGQYYDETGQWADWHVPETHTLEAWSDARSYEGTTSIIQPLIHPLYEDGRSAHEIVAILQGEGGRAGYDIVRGYWQGKRGPAMPSTATPPELQAAASVFDKFWQRALHDGIIPATRSKAKPVTLQAGLGASLPAVPAAPQGIEINFRPDPHIWDGRFANNGWLQECPRPLTKLSWDGCALVSPATAEKNSLNNGTVAEITANGRTLKVPIWIQPGQPDDGVTVFLGFGRTRAGNLGTGTGMYNAYTIRTAAAPWVATGAQLKATVENYRLATTQHHHAIDVSKLKPNNTAQDAVDNTFGRDIVRMRDISSFIEHPDSPGGNDAEQHAQADANNQFPSEWPSDTGTVPGQIKGPEKNSEAKDPIQNQVYGKYQWAMGIDLNACIGCNACVLGCQSENNIATVGKDQVARGREMHWIRIDTYHKGPLENPDVVFQPMTCMQCEKAPCELVCPVEATSHSAEGINEQTYNRCIGTKYCSNNCPYKVRRFNFLQYSDQETTLIKLMKNPDVTVRSRGVMEKCTYCIQRINEARIQSEKEGRDIRDGDIVTACQQSCPTDAIMFGDIMDQNSRINQWKSQPHNYGVLTELNTKPRTTYLERFRNPNPEVTKLDNKDIQIENQDAAGTEDAITERG